MKPRLTKIISLCRQRRRGLSRRARKAADAALRIRYLIIVLLAEGYSSVDIEHMLKVARAHGSRTARRFQQGGEAALQDRREENGGRNVDDRFLTRLRARWGRARPSVSRISSAAPASRRIDGG